MTQMTQRPRGTETQRHRYTETEIHILIQANVVQARDSNTILHEEPCDEEPYRSVVFLPQEDEWAFGALDFHEGCDRS